jgi:hypothetical protein
MTLSDVDTSSADSFTDACAHDPDLVRLRQRVRVVADGPDRAGTPVDVRLRDGRELNIAFDVNTPASDLDEQRAALRAKFDALATAVLGPARTAELAALITTLDELPDVGELMRASREESA